MEQLEEDHELYDFDDSDDSDEGNTSEETTENSTPISAKVEANIVSFISRIKQMAPMVDRTIVKPRNSGDSRQISCPNLNYLVSQLCCLSQSIEYRIHGGAHVSVVFQLDGIRDLVDIRYASVRGASKFIQLAQKSAQTLQSLELHTFLCRGAADLIEDTNGGCVTYPRLIFLTLFHATCISDKEEPTFEGAVPFPALKSLRTINSYPFGDDTPFRGNEATLESLAIYLGDFEVSILRKHNVFTPTSHPKLLYVNARYVAPVVPDTFATYAEELRFILGVGPGAPVRIIESPKSVAELTLALSSFGSCADIQFLLLPRIHLKLLEVIALIKLLPQLSDLTIAPYIRVPEIADVAQSELPAYMISTYSPTGKRFKCLRWNYAVFGEDDGINVLVECILLLALVCPNFTHIMQFHIDCKKLEGEIETTIASDRFKEHVSRLQCLRVSRW